MDCSGNVYDIKVDGNLQYKVYPDLPCYGATEGTYFTAARASDWTGGTVSKVDGWDVLTLDNRDVKEVTYKYDTGNAKIGKVAFTLKTEVPAKYIHHFLRPQRRHRHNEAHEGQSRCWLHTPRR
ncbi:MAG: hypothetical protein V8S57_06560 [Oscillospiraceae bacterium]